MKTLALLALALLTTPAAADTWVNSDLTMTVLTDDKGLHYATEAGDTLCAWQSKSISPVGNQLDKWKCDNGTTVAVELLPQGRLGINGVIFRNSASVTAWESPD